MSEVLHLRRGRRLPRRMVLGDAVALVVLEMGLTPPRILLCHTLRLAATLGWIRPLMTLTLLVVALQLLVVAVVVVLLPRRLLLLWLLPMVPLMLMVAAVPLMLMVAAVPLKPVTRRQTVTLERTGLSRRRIGLLATCSS